MLFALFVSQSSLEESVYLTSRLSTPGLCDYPDHPDPQRYATLILQNLAADSKMVTSLLRAGMVSPLLNLLSNLNASSLPDASLHTLAVLRCLSVDDLVKPRTFRNFVIFCLSHTVWFEHVAASGHSRAFCRTTV